MDYRVFHIGLYTRVVQFFRRHTTYYGLLIDISLDGCCSPLVSYIYLLINWFPYCRTRLHLLTVLIDIHSSVAISRWVFPDFNNWSICIRSAISSISAGLSRSIRTHCISLVSIFSKIEDISCRFCV